MEYCRKLYVYKLEGKEGDWIISLTSNMFVSWSYLFMVSSSVYGVTIVLEYHELSNAPSFNNIDEPFTFWIVLLCAELLGDSPFKYYHFHNYQLYYRESCYRVIQKCIVLRYEHNCFLAPTEHNSRTGAIGNFGDVVHLTSYIIPETLYTTI